MSTVLIVDERSDIRENTARLLTQYGHSVREAFAVREAASLLKCSAFDVVLCGAEIENDDDGLQLMLRLNAESASPAAILVSGRTEVAEHMREIRGTRGTYLQVAVDRLYLPRGLQAAATTGDGLVHPRRQNSGAKCIGGDGFVAVDSKTLQLYAKIEQAAAVDSPVLIVGESGTGKELIARTIFATSTHRRHRFVPVNCGAIPETLIASELFGYRRGAFTGATSDRQGLIEQADGSVLFLDEIGDMPPSTQVHLLRFLDSGEIRRIGESAVRHVDVRTIAATNRPLERDIESGRFRLDLFYRLSVLLLYVPPLRERRADIPVLAHHYLSRGAARFQRNVRAFSPGAVDALQSHDWPGNVRELQNAVESAVIQAASDTIQLTDLPPAVARSVPPLSSRRHSCVVRSAEITVALERFGGNHTRAAAALGISRTTLWRKLRRTGIMT